MSGTALSNFTDFMKSSPSVFLTDEMSIVNEAAKRTYVLSKFLRGRDMSEVLQGGSKIKDEIMFDDGSTAEQTRPGATHTWQNPQVLTEWEINWRFTIDHMSWNKHEFLKNNYSNLVRNAKRALFKKMQRQKEQRLWTSTFNHMEELLWRQPSYSEMEAAGGLYPYSIPCLVNEFTNGLPGGTTWTASGSTIMGINAATESGWRPYQTTYDVSDFLDTDGDADALFDALGKAWRQIRFTPPDPSKGQYFEQDKTTKTHIFCSELGQQYYVRGLRAGNDRFVTGAQDPAYGMPRFMGVLVEYIAQLDSAAVYSASSGNGFGTESSATTAGPRFYLLNGEYLKAVFHEEDYFAKTDPMIHPNQPDTRVQAYSTSWNMVARSRQRHAIVSPA